MYNISNLNNITNNNETFETKKKSECKYLSSIITNENKIIYEEITQLIHLGIIALL